MNDIIVSGQSALVIDIHLTLIRFRKWLSYGGPYRCLKTMWFGPFHIQKYSITKGCNKQWYIGKRINIKKIKKPVF